MNNGRVSETRDQQDKISSAIYNFNIKIPVSSCKSADIILDYKNNPNLYPFFKRIVKESSTNSVKYRPSLHKFFVENSTLDAVKNYDKFKSFVIETYPNKNFSHNNILKLITDNVVTRKFYIKKF